MLFTGPGTYFIVSLYKTEHWVIDKPTPTNYPSKGAVQKMMGNGAPSQQWTFSIDPTAPERYRIKLSTADLYLVEDTANKWIGYTDAIPGAEGSWKVIDAQVDGTSYLVCGSDGNAIDYWSDSDALGGKIGYAQYTPGTRQQMWFIQAV